jgi:hypothetical protein
MSINTGMSAPGWIPALVLVPELLRCRAAGQEVRRENNRPVDQLSRGRRRAERLLLLRMSQSAALFNRQSLRMRQRLLLWDRLHL